MQGCLIYGSWAPTAANYLACVFGYGACNQHVPETTHAGVSVCCLLLRDAGSPSCLSTSREFEVSSWEVEPLLSEGLATMAWMADEEPSRLLVVLIPLSALLKLDRLGSSGEIYTGSVGVSSCGRRHSRPPLWVSLPAHKCRQLGVQPWRE